MVSDKQLAANRRNAQKSTGPRTLRGKAITRFNAMSHGIYAEQECLPGENPEQLRALADSYLERWDPSLDEERYMVDKLIRCDWMTRRFQRIEVSLWTHLRCQESYHFHQDRYKAAPNLEGLAIERSRGEFNRLQRRIDATHRTYMETLATLEAKAQAAGEALQAREAEEAARAEAQARANQKAKSADQAARYKAERADMADFFRFVKLTQTLRGPDIPDSEYQDNFVPARPEEIEPPEAENGFVPSAAPEEDSPAAETDAPVSQEDSSGPPAAETEPTEPQPLTNQNGFVPSTLPDEQAA